MKKFMLVVLLMLASTGLYAGEVDNFVEVGADVAFYDAFTTDTDLTNSAALNVRAGTLGATGLYAWGSYEQPEVSYAGVDVSKVRMFGVGGGLRIPFDNGMYAFTELGYYSPSSNSSGVDVKYDGNFGGALGLGYDITDSWTVNTKYRFLKIDSTYNDTEAVSDMTSINIGVSYRF
jgi:opacity protein-like surface antigen